MAHMHTDAKREHRLNKQSHKPVFSIVNKPLKTTFLARAHLEANAYILFVWAHILEVISMFEEDEEWEEVEEDEEDW
jgi:hypothetical protein